MKDIKKILVGILFLLMTVIPGFAAFDDIGWTPRSKAMGNAMFGDFDAINSMHYNPAAISMARSFQGYFSWDTPYAGLNDGTGINTFDVDIVAPFFNKFTIPADTFFTRRGAIAFSFHRVGVGDSSYEYYHEGLYSFFYAKDLNDVLLRGAKMSAGVRMSLYDIGVSTTAGDVTANPYLSGNTWKLSFGLDLGITYDFSEAIRLGLVYKNLIAPNVGFGTNSSPLPTEFRLGGNWNMGDLFFMKDFKLGIGMVSYGRSASDNRQSDSVYNVGMEFKQLNAAQLIKGNSFKGEMLAVRFGANYLPKKVGDDLLLGLKGVLNFSTGLGFRYVFARMHEVDIDYALEFSVNTVSFEHSAGLTYKFLLPNSAFAYKQEVKKELEFEELMKKKQLEKKAKEEQKKVKETNKTKDKKKSKSSKKTRKTKKKSK